MRINCCDTVNRKHEKGIERTNVLYINLFPLKVLRQLLSILEVNDYIKNCYVLYKR